MDQSEFGPRRFAVVTIVVAAVWAAIAIEESAWSCGPFLTFRAYLKRSFWEPIYYRAEALAPSGRSTQSRPFAGFLPSPAPPALAAMRQSYSIICSPNATASSVESAINSARQALAVEGVTGDDLEEAQLLDCKIAMRLGEGSPGMPEVQRKFERFLTNARNPWFASEARGWLARVLYLRGDYAGAAKIYLDEADSPSSILGRDVLVTSLRMAYREGENQLWSRLEEFFDTPRHALFILNLITNGSPYSGDNRRKGREANGRRALQLLKDHQSLFSSRPDSEALAMASMRVSLYLGDPESALRFSRQASRSGSLLKNPEFNWMVALSHFVRGECAAAERPLIRMLNAPSATPADRITAAQAMIGVYFKSGRKIDALRAALIQASEPQGSELPDSPRVWWCDWCDSLDLPYLLDAYSGPEDLRGYLKKYPRSPGSPIPVFGYGQSRKLSATQVVQYSLAVHLARREEYAGSARIYESLGVAWRARRMQKAAALLARTRDRALSKDERLKALYDYGSYLADNPERLFFNDLFWRGFQSDAFIGVRMGSRLASQSQSGLTARERKEAIFLDRNLRDTQEERWRAYQTLEQLAEEAGYSDLGRRAVVKLLDSLARINTDRFGRVEEISSAIAKWRKWLRRASKTANPAG